MLTVTPRVAILVGNPRFIIVIITVTIISNIIMVIILLCYCYHHSHNHLQHYHGCYPAVSRYCCSQPPWPWCHHPVAKFPRLQRALLHRLPSLPPGWYSNTASTFRTQSLTLDLFFWILSVVRFCCCLLLVCKDLDGGQVISDVFWGFFFYSITRSLALVHWLARSI